MTTKPRGRAFRRQFLLLSRKRLGLEAAQRIFLVQSLRNQWLCRFACTKAAALFRRRSAFSWCKAYAINGFAALLAPKPPPLSGGAAHFLGAKPTQSMALRICLHQSRRSFRAARCIFLVQILRNQWLCRFACTKAAALFERRRLRPVGYRLWRRTAGLRATSSLIFPSPGCASGIPVSAFRLLPCASVLRFWASSPRSRRSPGVPS